MSRSIERKEERIIDLQYERIPYTNEYVDKLLNQQKEFIKYLEDESKEIYRDGGLRQNIFRQILQKYREIIEGKHE